MRPVADRLPGKPAREQAHQRAGVSDVDHATSGFLSSAQTDATHDDLRASAFDSGADGLNRGERAVGVL